MPARDAGKYISECLSSIRRQTFSFWELIIVDDGSTDNTRNIIDRAIQQDSRIQVHDNKGQGIIPALKLALSQSSGQLITRMDADDIMPLNRLELMHEAIQSTPIKTVVTGLVKYVGASEISEGYLKYEQWLNDRTHNNDHWNWVYRECVIASPNWMIRKSDLDSMEGFSTLSYPEDYHLVLKWHQNDYKIKGISEVTLYWREHPERTSRNSDHYNQESFFRMKIAQFVEQELGKSDLVLWGTGVKGRLSAEILKDLKIDFSWMDLKPPKHENDLLGIRIHSFKDIEGAKNIKLLISVYPETSQLTSLKSYLDGLNLRIGRDYWFL